MSFSRSVLLAAALALAAAPGPARAQSCQVAAENLEFGSYSSFAAAPVEASATITVRCDTPAPVPVTVSLDSGEHSGGFAPRQLGHAYLPDRLGYLLFTDASMTTVWGDGTRGSGQVVRRAGGATVAEIPIHGRIPAGQDVSVGRFSDRVTVHVDW